MTMNLQFVYNAENDLFSKGIDFAHKVLSPSTYKCELCALTHGNFGQRKAWIDFVNEGKVSVEFLYISEFEKKWGKDFGPYPIVRIEEKGGWRKWLGKEDIKKISSLEALIGYINDAHGLSSKQNNSSIEI